MIIQISKYDKRLLYRRGTLLFLMISFLLSCLFVNPGMNKEQVADATEISISAYIGHTGVEALYSHPASENIKLKKSNFSSDHVDQLAKVENSRLIIVVSGPNILYQNRTQQAYLCLDLPPPSKRFFI